MTMLEHIRCGGIPAEVLGEFMSLYKKEFDEDIASEDAAIIANNLVDFYSRLYNRGVFQAVFKKEQAKESVFDH